MSEAAADGAEIAVTEEMLAAGRGIALEIRFGKDLSDDPLTALYRAMRVLEPTKPSGATIYDMTTDQKRPVTQADVDALVEVNIAYGALRRHVETVHAGLHRRVTEIRSKHGLPHVG